jgi:hypothetical protein
MIRPPLYNYCIFQQVAIDLLVYKSALFRRLKYPQGGLFKGEQEMSMGQ